MTSKEKKSAREHAISMLDAYLPNGATLYGMVTQFMRESGARKSAVFVIGVRAGSLESEIIDVSLYVANVMGCRRDKQGRVMGHFDIYDIAENIGSALNRKIKAARL